MPDLVIPAWALTHAAMFALGAAAMLGLLVMLSRGLVGRKGRGT